MHQVQLLVLFFVVVSGAASLVDDTCLAELGRQRQNASQADSPRPWAVLLWVTCVSRQAGASAAAGALVRNCAGVLAKDNWILTTADCVSCPGRGEQVSVTADVGSLSNDIQRDQLAGNKVQRLSVDKVAFHPNYAPGGARGNVALLHLSVRISEAAKFVLRLANCRDNASFSQLTAQSSGWVSALSEHPPGADRLVLRDSSVSLLPKDTCSRALGPHYPDLLCSVGVGPSLPPSVNATSLVDYYLSVEQCYPKKGSPLVVVGKPGTVPRSDNPTTIIGCEWQLLGLLSLGAECNTTGPSLFVNLCSYEAWLENTIQTENARFEVFSACPSPPQAPANGYLCSSNDPLSGIQFCCNDGFRLVGSAMSPVCNLASKRWEPLAPLCEPVKCLPLPSPEHGSTQPQSCSNSSYLSSCLFSCDEGYRLVGNGLLTCARNGTWSSLPPRCNVIDCGPPQQAASLKVQYSTTEFGASALYQCGECFRNVGGNVTTVKHCDVSGVWRGSSPICEAVQCVPIVAPLNGGVSQTSSLCGSSVRFYCNEGYLLVGMEGTVCLMSGQWSNPVPICMSVSCPAPIVEGSNFNFSSRRYLYGRTVQVECDHCRRLEGGDGWLTCDTTGYWNRPLPRCNWIACPPPPFVPNLLMNPPGSLYFCDTTVQFSCSYGYQIEGAVTSTCQGNGTWSDAFPTCKAVTCPPLSLSNGVIRTEPGPMNISYFACDPCFKLNGPPVIQCTSSGTWNDTIPRCDLILCSPLKPFMNGRATPGLVENRCSTSVTFECHPGYILNGPTSTRCASNGTWDQPQPTCQAVACPQIPAPKSNSFICTATPPAPQFGATIKYCCAEGHQVVGGGGSDYVTCTEDGVWSASAPVCQATTCLTPPAPSNGALTVNNSGGGMVVLAGSSNLSYHGYKSQVTFRCNAGYVLIGESVLTCGPTGSWDHPTPACRMSQCDYRCPPPSIPTNGRLANIIYPASTNSTLVLGTVAVFVCDAGFYLAGSASRTCRENGMWSDQVTRCYPFDQPRSKLLYKIGDMPWQSNEQAYMSSTDRIVLACQTQLKETGLVQSISKLSGPTLDRNVRVVQSGSPDSSLQLSLQPLTASSGLSVAGVYKCQVRSTTDGSIVLIELLKIKVYNVLCPIPMSPANGSLLTVGTPPGSCSLYTCNEGYSLVGMETSVCYENRTWSNKQPVCGILCDPPVLTASVFVSPPPSVGGRYRVGDAVVYRCDPPTYRIVGASGAVCKSDSIWSAAPPICIATL